MPRAPVDRPAPADLELVRAFVNTLDLDKGTDELAEADRATRWLRRHRLAKGATPVSDRDLGAMVETREAFRAVLVANARGGTPADALEVLNALAERCGMATRLTGPASSEVSAVAARGIDVALGRLLAIALEAIKEGTWARLKACPSPTCHWAYYDRSRNRTARWCDMGLCGNRAKRDARRRRGDGAASSSRR